MPSRFMARVAVRWSDQDANGHVNNARVATLLEEARLAWRADLQSISGVRLAMPTVIASLHIDFRHPVSHRIDVLIDVLLTRVGHSSYALSYVGRQDSVIVFEAQTVQVHTSTEGRTAPLPATDIAALQPLLVDVTHVGADATSASIHPSTQESQ